LWIFGPLIFGALGLLAFEEIRKLIVNRLFGGSSPATIGRLARHDS
jgi:hypothetical protein